MGHKKNDKLFLNKNQFVMIIFSCYSRRRRRGGCRSSGYTGLDAVENEMGKAFCHVQMQGFALIYTYAQST